MGLSKAEEQLMNIIWQNGAMFFKEILEAYPNPKPASTTVATLLKRIQEKGFIGYNVFGNSRQYYALVKKSDHFLKHMKGMIKDYFDNSPMRFVSFFTESTNLSDKELEDLKKMIEQIIEKKKK